MITSIDAKEHLTKIQHSFLIKIHKTRQEGNFPQSDKGIYEKHNYHRTQW